jgi:nucleoid-associated protein YgaU
MAKLRRMKFKEYTWPYNPYSFNVTNDKRYITHEYPDINSGEVEDMGSKSRIFNGAGTFHGPNAYSNYKKLESIYKKADPGILDHPIYGRITCVFSKLNVKHEPTPDFVEYDFEFVEHKNINTVETVKVKNTGTPKPPPAPKTKTYIVKRGDNLWNISKRYYGHGKHWRRIANANKKLIKNPDLIYPGWKLVIP